MFKELSLLAAAILLLPPVSTSTSPAEKLFIKTIETMTREAELDDHVTSMSLTTERNTAHSRINKVQKDHQLISQVEAKINNLDTSIFLTNQRNAAHSTVNKVQKDHQLISQVEAKINIPNAAPFQAAVERMKNEREPITTAFLTSRNEYEETDRLVKNLASLLLPHASLLAGREDCHDIVTLISADDMAKLARRTRLEILTSPFKKIRKARNASYQVISFNNKNNEDEEEGNPVSLLAAVQVAIVLEGRKRTHQAIHTHLLADAGRDLEAEIEEMLPGHIQRIRQTPFDVVNSVDKEVTKAGKLEGDIGTKIKSATSLAAIKAASVQLVADRNTSKTAAMNGPKVSALRVLLNTANSVEKSIIKGKVVLV